MILNKIKLLFAPTQLKYSNKEIAKWMWDAWESNRLQVLLNTCLGLLGVALSLTEIWAVKNAIDVASGYVEGSVYWSVALMAILILIGFAISIAGVWVKNILGIKAQNRMQQKLLHRLLRLEWQGREQRHSGDILNRLETDVSSIVTFLTETLPSAVSVLFMFLGAFTYLFIMDKWLAISIVFIVPLFVLLSKIYVKKMRVLTRKVRDSDSKVQSILQETIQNRMLIKTLERVDTMVEKLEDTQSELRQHVTKRTIFSVFSTLTLNIGFSFGYIVAFLWSAVRLSNHTLTFGGMTAFLQLVAKIQGPARSLTKLVPAFVNVFTAAERLMELEENALEEEGTPIYVPAPCGVKLNDVSYKYKEDEHYVLKNITFDFKPATCTAIVGETGAGKTTLIRLILALFKPTEGSVTMYGGDKECKLSPLTRCNFVYVPQGNTLMSGTIRDNLKLGKLDATEEDIEEALKLSCAEFVKSLPLGLNTLCDESGGGLSEGQAQRICIARALLRNRSIMILDEATSALDPETEQLLLENLLKKSNKTIIFITHRMGVMKWSSQILRINRIKPKH